MQSKHLKPPCDRTRLDAVADIQLAIDALHLGAHSIDRNDQFAGDLGVGVASGEQAMAELHALTN